jgi:RimJ/RimL family protein N-acetyltransferase
MVARKLTVLDKQKIVYHLQSLKGEDRRLRFGGTVSDSYIQEYVEKSFNEESKWFGVDHIDGYLIAACHAAIFNGEAELGCSVNPDYRNQGLAQSMFERAVTWLRTKGITTVFMHCLTENRAMRHIASKNDMVVMSEHGETDAEVEVEPATPVTHMRDAYMDRIALYDMLFRQNYNAFDFYWKRNI